ncbi:Transport-associated [Pseudorhizobium banfieldiae]|uniref:Transport-associated n=1 Tax=Pseudorhizobium banfieldiae TaxID=1125847 RepID=L0NJZ5_9HYPH|nr:BON domain-containing protein [Pseudorhizobium banfieldiae]CAD6616860.1 BON domain-containing protein [arsenite-oxidising bacterium NT-25]CCF20617.1 Transport-associated [Pseudorhizobium banfieldiae]
MVFKHQSFHEHPPTVENEFPPAAALESAVSDALAAAGGIDATGVHVVAEGSTIMLTGSVMSEAEVARAEQIARSVAGVSNVRNDIKSGRIA